MLKYNELVNEIAMGRIGDSQRTRARFCNVLRCSSASVFIVQRRIMMLIMMVTMMCVICMVFAAVAVGVPARLRW